MAFNPAMFEGMPYASTREFAPFMLYRRARPGTISESSLYPRISHGGPSCTLCGFCGRSAHQGPCGPPGSRARQRNRRQNTHTERSGLDPALAAVLSSMAASLSGRVSFERGWRGGHPGPEGHFRARGRFDDPNMDLKCGDCATCPCTEHRGRRHSKGQDRSQSNDSSRSKDRCPSRGRKRGSGSRCRERENRRDSSRSRDDDNDGRRRTRQHAQKSERPASDRLTDQLSKARGDIERLKDALLGLKEQIRGLKHWTAQAGYDAPRMSHDTTSDYDVPDEAHDIRRRRPSGRRQMDGYDDHGIWRSEGNFGQTRCGKEARTSKRRGQHDPPATRLHPEDTCDWDDLDFFGGNQNLPMRPGLGSGRSRESRLGTGHDLSSRRNAAFRRPSGSGERGDELNGEFLLSNEGNRKDMRKGPHA